MAATQTDKAIAWAKKQLGRSAWAGRCQAFVADCFASGAGMPRRSAESAKAACALWRVSTSWNSVPAGAAVYFTSPSAPQSGHVGLSIGGGQMIHAFSSIKQQSIADVNARGYKCLGWGWNGGVKPTGAGSYSGADITIDIDWDGMDGAGSSGTAAAEPAVIHIPQTEKLYTKYERDDFNKKVDAYRLVWQRHGGKALDITSRAGNMRLKDDCESVAVELSFDVIGSVDDAYIGFLDVQTGDRVSLTNTATRECVFSGTVERTAGTVGETVSVTCYDGGIRLGANEILAQFDNCAAKEAISHIAGLCGLGRISCPNLISSVYEVYKTRATAAVQDILSTIRGETGVIYFPRVLGDCLVIKSFANNDIVPYFRQEANLPTMPCMAEITDPQISRDSSKLINSVQIYSTQDDTISVLATAEDAASQERYGKRNGIDTYSDKEQLTAAVKAANVLKDGKKPEERYVCTAFGSDKVIAGARLKVPVAGAVRLMYVLSVEHSYGEHHTMRMTLLDAEGVNR